MECFECFEPSRAVVSVPMDVSVPRRCRARTAGNEMFTLPVVFVLRVVASRKRPSGKCFRVQRKALFYSGDASSHNQRVGVSNCFNQKRSISISVNIDLHNMPTRGPEAVTVKVDMGCWQRKSPVQRVRIPHWEVHTHGFAERSSSFASETSPSSALGDMCGEVPTLRRSASATVFDLVCTRETLQSRD